jgi:hypothetical protein
MGFMTETPVVQRAFFATRSQRLHALACERTNLRGQAMATEADQGAGFGAICGVQVGCALHLRLFWYQPQPLGRSQVPVCATFRA